MDSEAKSRNPSWKFYFDLTCLSDVSSNELASYNCSGSKQEQIGRGSSKSSKEPTYVVDVERKRSEVPKTAESGAHGGLSIKLLVLDYRLSKLAS